MIAPCCDTQVLRLAPRGYLTRYRWECPHGFFPVRAVPQCGYCWRFEPDCLPVELSHDTRTWQPAILACGSCREYLRGLWRHARRAA